MKKTVLTVGFASLMAISPLTTQAQDIIESNIGDRINQRLDNRGDRINEKQEVKGRFDEGFISGKLNPFQAKQIPNQV